MTVATGVHNPKLDPQVRAIFEPLPPAPRWASMTAAEARAFPTPLNPAPEAVEAVTQRSIPGVGGPLAIRIHRPAGDGPHPALIYLHGGGWVLGGLETTDRFCRAMTNLASCVLIAVDYRLAPETKFPGGLDDAYTAVSWVARSADELGIDERRLAIGGFSAGANLAAAASMLARDRGGPAIAFQLLVQGCFDAGCDTPSCEEFADGIVMTTDDMRWFWGHYLARSEDADHPHASVLRALDLANLPPALVVTGECDLLRDEGEAYGRRLAEAGVPTTVRRYAGMPHGFLSLPSVDMSKRALNEIAAALRERLAPVGRMRT
jgi:acetyl esterase